MTISKKYIELQHIKVATDVLGIKAHGVLTISPTYPSREYEKAIKIAESLNAVMWQLVNQ